uniref:Cytochrome c oxidase assembly protein COX20, mitochondrial n=1 Tax=Hemiselmis tepida TaxID=464990 RepID=A0A7S0YK55_9CRYP|mmetsp:Transcript_12840/g.33032  ORF Transcript_12840/g.33032 Transcript_12840/m.33032 type:complete len:129 (+) Transcript_12840:1-387(+)
MGSDPLTRKPAEDNDTAYGSSREVIPLPDDAAAWWNLRSAPCFRETMMWSIGGSSLMGSLQIIRRRPAMQIGNVFVGTFTFLSLACWGVCRYETSMRHKAVSEAIVEQNSRQAQIERANREQAAKEKA